MSDLGPGGQTVTLGSLVAKPQFGLMQHGADDGRPKDGTERL